MTTDRRPVAVLLAGGQGRRMGGGDKSLRRLAGRPMLDHVITRVAPQVQAMVISANGDAARFADWHLPVVADGPGMAGPLAGVLAAMRWAQLHHPHAETLLSVPTDTPFLPADLATRLASAPSALACAASAGRAHPVAALWPVALADALEAALHAGERKISAWTARHGIVAVDFPAADHDPFLNVNTPADLAQAEVIARGLERGK